MGRRNVLFIFKPQFLQWRVVQKMSKISKAFLGWTIYLMAIVYLCIRPHCYVVAMCIILVSVQLNNAPSNTIATGSKITVYKMVTVGKVVLSMCNEV